METSHGAIGVVAGPIAPPRTTSPSWLVEPVGHGLAEVAAHDVEVEAELGPPLAEPRHGGVGLVLDDEEARHQPTRAPTRAPIP